jgi:DNA sulfur modification protein DndE
MKTKINISSKSDDILSGIKSKYTIRPNIICRYAVMLSLRLENEPDICKDNSGREFNRITLTGDDDLLIRELIKMHHGNFISDDEYMDTYLKAHLERGLTMLSNNIAQAKSFDNYLLQLIMNGELA